MAEPDLNNDLLRGIVQGKFDIGVDQQEYLQGYLPVMLLQLAIRYGIKPPEGDILDQAIISYIAYPQAGFHSLDAFRAVYGDVSTDQLEQWDIAREMCFRVAWKPYMYSQTLPHLLGGVRSPALLVWGDDDRIIPRSAADVYAKALRNARLEIVGDCGHFVDMEKPDELADLILPFVTTS